MLSSNQMGGRVTGTMQSCLAIAGVGLVILIIGGVGFFGADDTGPQLVSGLVGVVGAVVLVVGGIGAFGSWLHQRDAIRQAQLEQRVSNELTAGGATHIDFHNLNQSRVVAYVENDGQSCGALAHNLSVKVCVNLPDQPVYNPKIRDELEKLIARFQLAM